MNMSYMYVYLYMYTIMIHNIQLSHKRTFANSRKKSRGFPTEHERSSQFKLFTKTFRSIAMYIYIYMYLLESAEKCIDVLHLMILMYIYGIFFCTYIPYSFAGSKSSK